MFFLWENKHWSQKKYILITFKKVWVYIFLSLVEFCWSQKCMFLRLQHAFLAEFFSFSSIGILMLIKFYEPHFFMVLTFSLLRSTTARWRAERRRWTGAAGTTTSTTPRTPSTGTTALSGEGGAPQHQAPRGHCQ